MGRIFCVADRDGDKISEDGWGGCNVSLRVYRTSYLHRMLFSSLGSVLCPEELMSDVCVMRQCLRVAIYVQPLSMSLSRDRSYCTATTATVSSPS